MDLQDLASAWTEATGGWIEVYSPEGRGDWWLIEMNSDTIVPAELRVHGGPSLKDALKAATEAFDNWMGNADQLTGGD